MEKSSPKDVFLHLLSVIALYMSVGGLMTLLFQYINIAFPDRLDYYSYERVTDLIRYSMASLIIIFPVYLGVSHLLRKEYTSVPEKMDLKIRKWLVYFTLFAASITVITDLVVLIYNFLGGDLTARFILKILVVLLMATGVFWYYLKDLKNKLSGTQLFILVWISSFVVAVSIISGFFTAGSPFHARLWKFDQRRINDLQSLESQIIYYWQQKDKLPTKISDLNNAIQGYETPVDPETKKIYQYSATNNLSFKLCADFNLDTEEEFLGPSKEDLYGDDYNKKWTHKKGNVCFDRIIDPELYRQKVSIIPEIPVGK